ncbi:MAG: NAD(P) transhydrogenase subunit alpha [Saprospiraceae bacterium]|nr:NAD(P) transhydrogenase subunit alpha [Saprospiraceae bacterium]
MEGVIDFITQHLTAAYILIFAIILGYELISRVPTVLHTPLMSGTNAISGIITVGGILLLRTVDPSNTKVLILGTLAVALGMINIIGGYAVTDRMLKMFKKKPKKNG